MRMLKGPNKKFEIAGIPDSGCRLYLNLPVLIPDKKGKLILTFIALFCGASKGLRDHTEMWKWKFKLIFILKQLTEMRGAGSVVVVEHKICC